jgi:hypothetical protein
MWQRVAYDTVYQDDAFADLGGSCSLELMVMFFKFAGSLMLTMGADY